MSHQAQVTSVDGCGLPWSADGGVSFVPNGAEHGTDLIAEHTD